GDLGRRRRGLQQQSETDHQKSLRLSVLSLYRNRPVPYAGSTTGARSYPQILLKTPNFQPSAPGFRSAASRCRWPAVSSVSVRLRQRSRPARGERQAWVADYRPEGTWPEAG